MIWEHKILSVPRLWRRSRRAFEKYPRLNTSLAVSVDLQAENSTYELDPVSFRAMGTGARDLVPPPYLSIQIVGNMPPI